MGHLEATSGATSRKRRLTAAWVICLLALPNISGAQTGDWESLNGPPGVDVYSILRTDAGNLVAGTAGKGVFTSDDGGSIWQRADDLGLLGQDVRSIAESPDGTLLAATFGAGVFRSVDRGRSFERFNEGLDRLTTYSVLMLDDTTQFLAAQDGVFRSKGERWTRMPFPVPGRAVWTLAASEQRTLYAGVLQVGVLRSEDLGATWDTLDAGLTGVMTRWLAAGPDETVFLATFDGDYVYRWDDNQSSWTGIGDDLITTGNWTIASLPDGRVLLGSRARGIFYSDDMGQTWQKTDAPATVVKGFTFANDPDVWALDGSVWAATQNGILYSNDRGVTWSRSGLPASEVTALYADNTHVVAGLGQAGVFRRAIQGDAWLPTSLITTPVYGLVQGSDGILLAATLRGVSASSDGGGTWKSLGLGHQTTRDVISTSWGELVAVTQDGVYTFGADSIWHRSGLTAVAINAIVETATGDLVVGTKDSGLYRSPDRASSWTAVSAPGGRVNCLLFADSGVLLAGTLNHGLQRSDDNGVSWSPVESVKSGVVTIVEDHAHNVIVGTVDGEVFTSSRGIGNWSNDTTATTGSDIISMVTDHTGYLYIGTADHGVLRRRYVVTSSESVGTPARMQKPAWYPNPTQGPISARLVIPEPGTYEVVVRDVIGREVLRRSDVLSPGVRTLKLNLDGLPTGMYGVSIQGPDGLSRDNLVVHLD